MKMKWIKIEDEYLKCVDKKIKFSKTKKNAFLIKEKANNLINKTMFYKFDLKKVKNICKAKKVTITEYITALYMYALYKTVYDNRELYIAYKYSISFENNNPDWGTFTGHSSLVVPHNTNLTIFQ